jgi:hypothetical protein
MSPVIFSRLTLTPGPSSRSRIDSGMTDPGPGWRVLKNTGFVRPNSVIPAFFRHSCESRNPCSSGRDGGSVAGMAKIPSGVFSRGNLGTFYIPLVKNFFNRCYYSLLRCHPGDWAHLTTRYFEGSASFSSFDKLRTSFSANSQPGEENETTKSKFQDYKFQTNTKTLNSKSEYRNSKQIRMFKIQMIKTNTLWLFL